MCVALNTAELLPEIEAGVVRKPKGREAGCAATGHLLPASLLRLQYPHQQTVLAPELVIERRGNMQGD